MLVLRALVAAAEEAGASRTDMLAALGLSASDLELMDARVPANQISRASELALELTHDPALGLHWIEQIKERAFGPVTHALSYAPTLREGFQLLSKFEPLLFEGEPAHLLIEGATTFRLQRVGWPAISQRVHVFASELVLAGFMKMIRAYCPNAQAVRAGFDYPAPAHAVEYSRVFGPDVRFEQSVSEIELDRALLDAPSPHVEPHMHATMQRIAEQRLLQTTQSATYAVQLRKLILERQPQRTNMLVAARALSLSERTLRKKLASEGTSYREIEYAALETIASQLLKDKRCTVQETAFAMGFSDVTNFHRAFKRWTGKTPSELRAGSPRRPAKHS